MAASAPRAPPPGPLVATLGMATASERVKVAVLYSGRFYGEYTPMWYGHHLDTVIRPNNATVFITVDVDNWCHAPLSVRDALKNRSLDAAQAAFERQVRTAFKNWPLLHSRFIPPNTWATDPAITNMERLKSRLHGMYQGAALRNHIRRSSLVESLIVKWYEQWLHHSHVDHFMRQHESHHDVLVRLRLDLVFPKPPLLPPPSVLSDTTVYAISVYAKVSLNHSIMGVRCDDDGRDLESREHALQKWGAATVQHFDSLPCQRLFDDKIFIGSETAMQPLGAMIEELAKLQSSARKPSLPVDKTTRCCGLCPEEQTVLWLKRASIAIKPLASDWKSTLVRAGSGRDRAGAGRMQPVNPTSDVCRHGSTEKIG